MDNFINNMKNTLIMTKEEIKEYHKRYNKQYYTKNRDKILEQKKQYQNTPMGRALCLLMAYNAADKKYNRGKGDLTTQWIVDNIFTKPCVHCGESDWKKIGCNRIDNNLPHTKDNVEPCCWECNLKLNGKDLSKQVYQYSLDGELIRVWESTMEAVRNGFNSGNVSSCCNGKLKTHGGYKWSFNPL